MVYNTPKVMATWHVSHNNWNAYEQYDVAWDIWLGGINEPNPTNPGVEIMVWLNYANTVPIGSV